MNYLKKFESFQSHEDIYKICEQYNIKKYTINSDESIDVDDNVNFFHHPLLKLPLKFNKVSGNFYCASNKLTTLEGAPQSVDGNFDCSNNRLTTLEGAPHYVGGDFECFNNKLTTLEGAPHYVGGDFSCSNNYLTTLEGGPQTVNSFICSYNENLKSLNYLPKYIGSEEVYFRYTAVYELFKLLDNFSLGAIRYVNDFDIVVDNKINIEVLNDFLYDQGKSPVEKVKGYNNI